MKRQITGLILIVVVLIVMPFQVYAATPKETVEAGVTKLLKTLGDPAFKAKSEAERIAIIGTEIETVFDFKELSRSPTTGPRHEEGATAIPRKSAKGG